MTCPKSEEARKIVAELLDRRLIACANIMAPHESHYVWQDKRETTQEVAIIMKTQAELFEQVRAAICDLHSYECPCIVALDITQGHTPFMEWITAQTTN